MLANKCYSLWWIALYTHWKNVDLLTEGRGQIEVGEEVIIQFGRRAFISPQSSFFQGARVGLGGQYGYCR